MACGRPVPGIDTADAQPIGVSCRLDRAWLRDLARDLDADAPPAGPQHGLQWQTTEVFLRLEPFDRIHRAVDLPLRWGANRLEVRLPAGSRWRVGLHSKGQLRLDLALGPVQVPAGRPADLDIDIVERWAAQARAPRE